MRVLSVDVLRRHENGRPVVNGFVSYISPTKPHLMLCTGFEDYSDGYDDFTTTISHDNGATWEASVPWLKSHTVAEGRLRYAEPAALFDAETGKLIVLVDENLYPADKLDVDGICRVCQNVYDPATEQWSGLQPLDLTPGRSLAVSFGFPIKTATGRLLVPAMRPMLDETGKPVHYRGCWATADEALTLIGEYGSEGSIHWHLGRPVPVDLEQTSRGLNENTLAELANGRLAMVCRGDNSMFPERPRL